jgi:ATP synthase protein I
MLSQLARYMSSHDENPPPDRRIPKPPGSGDDLDNRLEQLRSKLGKSTVAHNKHVNDPNRTVNNADRAGIGQAFRLSSEFIAGVVVGAGIGYLVDTFFGTSPWGLIVFLMLGFAAAVLNVMRAAGMVAESQMRLKPAQELHNGQQDADSDRHAEK